MFGFLKKIYKRKKNASPKDPAPLSKQLSGYNLDMEDKGVETPDLKVGDVKEKAKTKAKSAISQKKKLKPEHHEFIVKLARKNNPVDSAGNKAFKSLVSKKSQPENAAKKRLVWKKIN